VAPAGLLWQGSDLLIMPPEPTYSSSFCVSFAIPAVSGACSRERARWPGRPHAAHGRQSHGAPRLKLLFISNKSILPSEDTHGAVGAGAHAPASYRHRCSTTRYGSSRRSAAYRPKCTQ